MSGYGDTNILQRVDALSRLLNFTANDLRNQLGGKLSKSAAGGLSLHDFGHFLSNSTDLRRAGISGFLDLIGASLRKGNGE